MEYKTNSPTETKNVAKEFAKTLLPGDCVCIYGDLGAGKTAFVQGLAQGLGIEEPVTSPTFTIVNCYEGRLPLYHFDVYRIGSWEEMDEIGYEDYVYGDGVAVIEWPEQIAPILPEKRYDITISKDYEQEEQFRIIQIEKRG